MKIFIVEDSPAVLERLTDLVRDIDGVEVVGNAGNYRDAVTGIMSARPEVAILGLSRTATQPLWKGNQFVPREMLPLSLSYDHRVIDGADGIRFLRWVAEALEQPFLLALQG